MLETTQHFLIYFTATYLQPVVREIMIQGRGVETMRVIDMQSPKFSGVGISPVAGVIHISWVQ